METHEVKKEGSTFTDIFLRTIAVLGLIAVLLLGAWGIIQLAVAIPSLFGSVGGGVSSLFTNTNAQKETLTVSAPATINSGQTVQLMWTQKNYDTSVQYSYAISYACEAGLSLSAPVPTGAYQTVACNTPFDYVNATAHMTLIPTLTGTASAPLAYTVTATNLSTGVITSSGTATTTVAPSGSAPKPAAVKPAVTTTTKPASTYYAAPTRAALYGYPDLAVQIVSVTPSGTRTTVQFVISNVGTNIVAGGWTFNTMLPINGSYTFASQPQQALYPGDKIVYNLSFSNNFPTTQNTNPYPQYQATGYTAGSYTCNGYTCTTPTYNGSYPYNTGYNYTSGYSIGTVTITADPFNYIAELNKGNNTASATTPLY